MKHLLFGIIFLLIGTGVFAQNQIQQAEYWFNNQYAGAMLENLPPAVTLSFSRSLATDHLPNGLHTFHLRFRDSEEKWSSTLSSFFYKVPDAEISDNEIEGGEYWFNNGHDNAIPLAITNASLVNLTTSLDTEQLPGGLHTFHLRLRDSHLQWTSTLSSFFYKLSPQDAEQNAITSVQYWFNNNFAGAVSEESTPSQSLEVITGIETESLPTGLHTFHIRFKDETGKWSAVMSSFFYKPEQLEQEDNAIVAYEYWLNNVFEQAHTESFSGQDIFTLNEMIEFAELRPGLHTFHIRFKDEKGRWSTVQSAFFYHSEPTEVEQNLVTGYRYWFDENLDDALWVEFDEPENPFLLEELDLRRHPAGSYEVHLQFKDLKGLWSLILSKEIEKALAPYALFEADAYEVCLNTEVFFTNLSMDADEWLWDFGDGVTSDVFEPSFLFEEEGTFTVSLTVGHIDSELTDVMQAQIIVHPSPVITETHEMCEGDTYAWRGNVYDAGGTYEESFISEQGCPGFYVLELTVIPTIEIEETKTICEGDVFAWQGDDYDLPGTYYAHYIGAAGCDSIRVLHLHIESPWFIEEELSVCEGESLEWEGSFYDTAGRYEVMLTSVNGCDSLRVLHLALDPVYKIEEEEAICEGESFEWQGVSWETAGRHEVMLTSSSGCDSLRVLNLTINPVFAFEQTETICHDEVFSWEGADYHESGTYAMYYQTEHGCDSILTLNLEILSAIIVEQEAAICEGEVLEWEGNTYDTAGTFEVVYPSEEGCDSLRVLHLTVHQVFETEKDEEICVGEDLLWYGNTLTQAGQYFHMLESENGCDSLLVLNLNVFEVDVTVEQDGLTLTAMADNAAFQWMDCADDADIVGATGAEFTPEVTGEYAVWITQGNCTTLSDCYAVTITRINDPVWSRDIVVWPNPAQESLQVTFSRPMATLSLRLLDLQGRRVMEKDNLSGSRFTLPVYQLQSGVYFLEMESGGYKKILKVIKE